MTTALILAAAALLAWVLWPLLKPARVPFVQPHTGRHVATMPRLTTPDRPPWRTEPLPVLRLEPEPETPRRPAETSADPVPLARPYAPEVVYGEVPVQRMLAQEAARLTAVYLP